MKIRKQDGMILTIESDDEAKGEKYNGSHSKEENEESSLVSDSEDDAPETVIAESKFEFAETEDPLMIKSWDFAKLKGTAIPLSKNQTTVDQKIQHAKEKVMKKKEAKKKRKRDHDGEQEVDEQEGGENGNVSNLEEEDEDDGDDQDESEQGDSSDECEDEEQDSDKSDDSASSDSEFEQDKVRTKGTKDHQEAAAAKQANKKLSKQKALPLIDNFSELQLSKPLLKAVEALGWKQPTPIQSRTIPLALQGRDICGSAVTGSGKTGAFALPAIERLIRLTGSSSVQRRFTATRVLVVLPTRELAVQCHSVISALTKYCAIRSALVVGGLSAKPQEAELRTRPDIVVATPGRLVDHLRNMQGFSLEDVEILVIDEADRLFEMGFKDEMEELIRFIPKERQTLLFSATLSKQVEWLVHISLSNPIRLAVDPIMDVAASLDQEFVRIRGKNESNRDATLLALVSRSFKTKTIIFFAHKHVAHRFKIIFGLFGLKASELHGSLAQVQRLEALELFRDGQVDYLLCTDIAARGLDIVGVETVINYDMPKRITEYVHRVGRTARAGRGGRAVSLVIDSDRKLLSEIHKRAQEKLAQRRIPVSVIQKWREKIDGFEDEINEVLRDERLEKEMRLAEMQAQKAENMITFADQIKARPPRTWFQTETEKKAVKDKTKDFKNDADRESDEEKELDASKPKKTKKEKKLDRVRKEKEEKRKQELEEIQRDFKVQKRAKAGIRRGQPSGVRSSKFKKGKRPRTK